MKQFTSVFVLVCVAVVGCYGNNQPQTGPQVDQQDLLHQMMEDLRQGYDQKFAELEAQFNKRYLAMEAKYNQMKAELNRARRGHKRQLEISNVAFYAQLTHDQTGMGNYQAIVYDLVTTNHGNGYNHADGIFTAPMQGTYVFSWTSTNEVHSHMQTELVVNSQVKGTTWSDAYDHQDVAVASNTVVLDLKQGDSVWIRSNTVHSTVIKGSKMSTFSGWLLYL